MRATHPLAQLSTPRRGAALACAMLAVAGCSVQRSGPEARPSTVPAPQSLRGAVSAAMSDPAEPRLDIDLGAPLSAEALSAIVVLTNPELKALRAGEAVAEAQVFSAGLFPDPTFTFGVDVPRQGAGLLTAVAAALGIDLRELARRPHALRKARADLDRTRLDVAWAEWLTGERAKLLASRVGFGLRARELTRELYGLAEGDRTRALRAVERGDLAVSAMEMRWLAVADAVERDRAAEGELVAARLELNRLLGIDPEEEFEILGPEPASEPIPDSEVLLRRACETRADLRGLRAALDGARADRRLARLGRFPLPAVDVHGARDIDGVRTVGAGVSFTLPLWNRGRGDIAVAKATEAQLRAEYSAHLEAVRADVAAARAALGIVRTQLAELEAEMRSLALSADAVKRAAERGDFSDSAAAATEAALLDKRIARNGLARSAAELEIVLEIASGRPLRSPEGHRE